MNAFGLSRRRQVVLGALAGLVSLSFTRPTAAEPASCLSPDPSAWPAPAKPYIMLAVDTSGSMVDAVAGNNDCGYANTRNGHLRCALKHTFETFGGQVHFGLASSARRMTSCPPGSCAGDFGACTFQNPVNNAPGMLCSVGCGAEPDPGAPNSASRAGANILVPIPQDAAAPPLNNLPELLSWVDNTCTNGVELFANGCSPINGTLRDMFRYYSDQWTSPFSAATFSSPLTSIANGERPCRYVYVVFITDGDETCDAPADALDAANDLFTGFTKDSILWKVQTFVVNFIGGSPQSDNIAMAGGTGSSHFVGDAAELSQTLASILASTIAPEVCDNQDNNCNGCTDEGSSHYCDVGQACCVWATNQQRKGCLDSYANSISPALPNGDLALLPCTTLAQQSNPALWLCYNPKEVCDNVDNNCSGGIDEGVTKCGSPAHCPQAEICDGTDNDCDNAIDEGGICGACVPSPEVCDGCDNDCDGIADDGNFAPIPCGSSSPPTCIGVRTCGAPQAVALPGACGGAGLSDCLNAPTPETCDGIDNNCDGFIDNVPSFPPLPCEVPGMPNLVYGGLSQCTKGTLVNCQCAGAIGPGPEICDGVDNDCDGQIDEGALNVGEPCGVANPPCIPGATACVNGVLLCSAAMQPTPEICDGIDNDCDGAVDDAPFADGPPPGQTFCWDLPGNCCSHQGFTWCPPPGANCNSAGTLPLPCHVGALTCAGFAGWTCVNARSPAPETCDGIDDNCNGQVDDGSPIPVGNVCGSGEGTCKQGVLACVFGTIDCVGDVEPQQEVCDGLDNDCDGTPDNGVVLQGLCLPQHDPILYPGERDRGVCKPGTLGCMILGEIACVGGVGPTPELCDGIDNDCDGKIDEPGPAPDGLDGSADPSSPSITLGAACGKAVGACKQGTWKCSKGAVVCSGEVSPTAEACDCIDNDCDGAVDNAANPAFPLCVQGKQCIKTAGGCACAAPCPPELPCPPAQHCEKVFSGGTPGLYCVPDTLGSTGTSSSSASSTGSGAGGQGGVDAGGAGGMTPSKPEPWGLATGGGGCACAVPTSTNETNKTGAILPLLVVCSILRRRRARPLDHVQRPTRRGRLRRSLSAAAAFLLTLTLSMYVVGCTTEAFCFNDCGAVSTGAGTGGAGQTDGGTACLPTNGGVDICDKIDNDCDGVIDRGSGINFEAASSCGTCENDCTMKLHHCIADAIRCSPSARPGDEDGTCLCDKCEDGYYKIGTSESCDKFCVPTFVPETTCNGKDDDCDGEADEDVDFCSDVLNCGACGRSCLNSHVTAKCVQTGPGACDLSNTQCVITGCDCSGPGSCFWDLDQLDDNGCEYPCDLTTSGVEICDGLDNDCDGKTDALDDLSGDPSLGLPCYGDEDGECKTQKHAGIYGCISGELVCVGPDVLFEDDLPELCNGLDDDCDGAVDNNPIDMGSACGISNVFPCSFGTIVCISGALVCAGGTPPAPEICNGFDDDCDGVPDSTAGSPPSDSVGPCNVPPPPPPGATSPCSPGSKACIGGVINCQGGTGPTALIDACGVDENCDGALTAQPNLMTDPYNCGACGNTCSGAAGHAKIGCQNGACVFTGCEPGYYDLNGDQICEYACFLSSADEACDGVDNNCNGMIDESIFAIPTPTAVCGVSPAATTPECTSQVTVTCQGGTWKCIFPNAVCGPSCAQATEVCDGLDNNCNGLVDENVPGLSQPCAVPGSPAAGLCPATGVYVCSGPQGITCNAVAQSCSALPGGCDELCDGIDNDCDGSIDEPFAAKGANPAYFVKPTVTKFSAASWIYSYEASRPNATSNIPGSGNGYHTSAPPGVVLEKTAACSSPGKIPWYNVTGPEVQQTCAAMGGSICPTSSWTTACQATQGCSWGYAPRGAACKSAVTASKYCNLGPSYDFDPSLAGDQDGLLPAASPLLGSCWADLAGLFGNTASTNKIFDMTGNLREITSGGGPTYTLMGGSFTSLVETSAQCDNTYYVTDASFQYFDTGFRCCFDQDPTL